jgi:pyruvyltransferase
MPYPTVELIYWRPVESVNFGDELSRATVELMLSRRGITVFDEIPAACRLLAIGSIIHFAQDHSVVWGSGLNGSVTADNHKYTTLDVRAVRGPITRQFLASRGIEVPEVYGDPGLLIDILTNGRFGASKRRKVGLVPHMFDVGTPEVTRFASSSEISIIDPCRSWNRVVDEIASCEFIISSSLHGLVVADAYGIQYIYVRLGENEGLLKYEDYYAGTGRSLRFATSIEEALSQGPCAPARFDPKPLIEAFPYDIWTTHR